MSAKQSKNDISWKVIFEEENIIKKIKEKGFFEISSSKINEQREARLMTKFDHAVKLPKIFRDNGLTIQPISRGSYVIGTYSSYFQLPKKSSTNIIYRELPPHLKTIDSSNIYSESSAILCAFLSGMIDDVLGEPTDLTVLGRMSTGTFDYQIRDTKTNTNHNISVKNSQCEIDGGFEGETKFALIEAKSETVDDFIIRQLYYPYRLWTSKTDKEVIPIFLTISNDIFSFYRFRFLEKNVYNSLELVSEHRYCISRQEIEISDIRQLLAETPIVSEQEDIPFPQADSFPRIIDLLGRLYNANEPLSKDEITLVYAFDERQTNYYVTAARYLGLVTREHIRNQDVTFSLNSEGQSIMSQHPQRRNLALARCILRHKVFNESLNISLEQAQLLTSKEIVAIMTSELNKYSSTTVERRAQTVKGWIDWIVELTRV